ncbi:hypothetical protein Hamer_G006165 [Homarus americanus]|uniref:Uncharacterized protein n=1 Tax=Homarus americanus TaxID=6706 RepID=A0A8J5MM05_HOMAM|nr:hypothetical protein Hamer_G006165 [Homarus americanus]
MYKACPTNGILYKQQPYLKILMSILQETLMSKDKQFLLHGYQQYSAPKGPNSHGSMILVRATIPSSEVEPVHCGDGVEAQAFRIHLANESCSIQYLKTVYQTTRSRWTTDTSNTGACAHCPPSNDQFDNKNEPGWSSPSGTTDRCSRNNAH